MHGFGYGILKALVTDIEPDARVKEAMNEINAAQKAASGRDRERRKWPNASSE